MGSTFEQKEIETPDGESKTLAEEFKSLGDELGTPAGKFKMPGGERRPNLISKKGA
jgi:hypothetical protein